MNDLKGEVKVYYIGGSCSEFEEEEGKHIVEIHLRGEEQRIGYTKDRNWINLYLGPIHIEVEEALWNEIIKADPFIVKRD